MKKLILSAMLTGFAVALYAGDCGNGSCCSKTKTSQQSTSATCPASSKTVTKAAKSKNSTAKQTLQSPKAMSLASR